MYIRKTININMKKVIFKVLNKILKDREIYEIFIKDIVEQDRIKFIKELAKYPVFQNVIRDNCELEDINNCILINSRFSGCKIKSITNNLMRNAYISNNYIGDNSFK